MSLESYVVLASEAAGEHPVSIWVVGAIVLAIMVALLAIVIGIGGGRDHS